MNRDRLLLATLLGGVALLLVELRFEHREVLVETWHSWIPLVYSALTLVAGVGALVRWTAGARQALAILFGGGLAIGLLGFWFHTGGHLTAIWVPNHPPALAPLAFCGLGTLGVLICAGERPEATGPSR